MRVDARRGDFDWVVYHAERMCFIPHVAWADNVLHQYATIEPLGLSFAAVRIIQARKVMIVPAIKTVIINPISDDTDEKVVKHDNLEQYRNGANKAVSG